MEDLVPEPVLQRRFDQIQAGLARSSAIAEESWYTFGGHAARIRIAGRRLAHQMTRPFAHLRRSRPASDPPHLDVQLWDPSETGETSSVPWPAVSTPDSIVEIAVTGRFVEQRTKQGTVSLDRKTGRIVGVLSTLDPPEIYALGKPLARLLAEWYADRGVPVVHAGLVARGQQGVLLAGKGGSGKSTSALVCARAGLAFLGEDYAGLEFLPDGSVIGHSAYNSVFLDATRAAGIPEVAGHGVDDPAEPKVLVLLTDVWPECLRVSVPIRAVALCRVSPGDSCQVRSATPAQALLAIGPSTLLQIHGRRRNSLDRLARLVESIPAFQLDLGRDLESVPAAIDEILRRAMPTA